MEFVLLASCAASWQFAEPRVVGESNVTHFWMPGVGGIATVGRHSQSLLLTIDENGDGTPPVDCTHVKCAPRHYLLNGSKPSGWTARPTMASVPMNALIVYANKSHRGLSGIHLDATSNASGCISYTDWVFDEDGQQARVLGQGCAPIHGLPRMASTRVQIMPSGGTLVDGTRLAIAYGAVFNATSGGPGDGYSSFLFASKDGGASWAVRARFDRTEGMPQAVGCGGWSPPTIGTCGPCEPAFVVLNDGRTVVTVLRIQSGQNLWQAVSRDGAAVTWTEPTETSAWSVFPQMRALRNGAVVLAAGRPSIGMWQLDLKTFVWGQFVNLAAAHNVALPPSAPKDYAFDALEAAVSNCSSPVSSPALTKAYTALASLPCEGDGDGEGEGGGEGGGGGTTCSVVVAYDRLANGNGVPPGVNGQVDRVFTMRVQVEAPPGARKPHRAMKHY